MKQTGHSFQIHTVLGQGWSGFKSNWGMLIGLTLLFGVCSGGITGTINNVVTTPMITKNIETLEKSSKKADAAANSKKPSASKTKKEKGTETEKGTEAEKGKETKKPTANKVGPILKTIFSVEFTVVESILVIAASLIQLFLTMGLMVACLKTARGESPLISDLFSQWHELRNYGQAVLVSIIVWGLVLVVLATFMGGGYLLDASLGTLEFIDIGSGAASEKGSSLPLFTVLGLIPSILVIIMLGLYLYLSVWFIIDKKMTAVQSIKASMAATHGSKFKIFLFKIIVIGMTILVCIFTCCIGSFAFTPIAMIAMAHIYLALTGEPVAPGKTDKKSDDPVYAESPA